MRGRAKLRSTGIFGCAIAFSILAGCTAQTAEPNLAPTPVSPLDEFINEAWGTDFSPEAQLLQMQDRIMRQEEALARCMLAAGFEYIPSLANYSFAAATPNLEADRNDPDWVAQWGYGITAHPDRETTTQPTTPQINPNDEIRAKLSDAELEQYWLAFWGPAPEFTEYVNGVGVSSGDMRPFEEMGCMGQAWLEVPHDPISDAGFSSLFEAIRQLQSDIDDLPEVLAAESDWVNCMANFGHTGFDRQRHARWSIQDRVAALPAAIQDPAHPTRRAIQEQEIELALADLGCRESVDYDARVAAATLAAETQFVADHRTELEALRDAIEQRG